MTPKTHTGATNSLLLSATLSTLGLTQSSSSSSSSRSTVPEPSISSTTAMKLQNTTTIALALLLLLASSSFHVSMAGSDFCDGKCNVRCSKASRHDDCLKYCGICCAACNCVPSGTSGNKDECPCYRDKTTGKGDHKRPKCP